MTTFWQGVAVTVQDGSPGTAQTITAITKASNGQATTSGTPPTNGQYLLLLVAGMSQLNNRIVKVSGVSGSNFNINVDTTLFPDFVLGTFQLVTIDQAMTAMRNIASTGGTEVVEDTTTIHDLQDTEDVIGTSAVGYTFTEDFGSTAPGFLELRAAAEALAPRAVKFLFSNGKEQLGYASVSVPNFAAVEGKKAVTPISLKFKGRLTTI